MPQPRPFYIIGHNTNTIDEVNESLKSGANALEPDINVYSHDNSKLCISHGEGDFGTISLGDFLGDLHSVALLHPELALVEFDCKPAACTAKFGKQIVDAIESILLPGTDLNVIISVGSFDDTAIFGSLGGRFKGRIGAMIDEENSVIKVAEFFDGIGVVNYGFGNGIAVINDTLGPNIRPSIEHACQMRAATGRPKFINTWSVNSPEHQREYIRIGLDSMITDRPVQLSNIVRNEFGSVLRLATRADNPFKMANRRYGLRIHTADVTHAGTDANVTFTLTGSAGSVSKTIDTELNYRMESGDTNYVTIESDGIGALKSVAVKRDDAGNGEDWFLDRITVESATFGFATTAVFNRLIDSTKTFSVNAAATQPGWRWCCKCQGLFFGGKPTIAAGNGICPADKKPHDGSKSGHYAVLLGENGAGQQGNWRWCRKCQALFFNGTPPGSLSPDACPAECGHDATGSGHYAAVFGEESPGLQGSWKWCRKCSGMYFGGKPGVGTVGGKCPVDGKAHDPSGSGNYVGVFTSDAS